MEVGDYFTPNKGESFYQCVGFNDDQTPFGCNLVIAKRVIGIDFDGNPITRDITIEILNSKLQKVELTLDDYGGYRFVYSYNPNALDEILEEIEDDYQEELDSIVSFVTDKFKDRSKVGKDKYGVDLDREDLSAKEWANHLQEELMDGTLYVQKLIKIFDLIDAMLDVYEDTDTEKEVFIESIRDVLNGKV